MDREQLVLACILASAAGLALIAFSSHQPQYIPLSEISTAHQGKTVETYGEVKSAYSRNGNYFISLCDTECLAAVIFRESAERINTHEASLSLLKKGTRLRVVGSVEIYKGAPELVVESVEVLD